MKRPTNGGHVPLPDETRCAATFTDPGTRQHVRCWFPTGHPPVRPDGGDVHDHGHPVTGVYWTTEPDGPAPAAPVLGRNVRGTLDAEDIDLMHLGRRVESVSIETGELQAVCPVTGQPDVYKARIWYAPEWWVFESKALAMYLRRWRDVGISCEDLTATIADDLTRRLGVPVTVDLTQNVRGGLVITAAATGTPPTPTTEGATP